MPFIEPQHDLRIWGDVRSPCKSGETAYDNGVPPTVNGCGSENWQVAIGKIAAPYLSSFTSCCNTHDICFDRCGGPNFVASFESCNDNFKYCMYNSCDAQDLNFLKKAICKSNAYSFYDIVSRAGGKTAYEKAQKKHCGCRRN